MAARPTGRGAGPLLVSIAVLVGASITSPSPTGAQAGLHGLFHQEGADASEAEVDAFTLVEAGNLIKARELAERLLGQNPRSYVAHLVLAHVFHYAEANFPRGLYHAQRAFDLFIERHGRDPSPDQPWRWQLLIVKELAELQGKLEHYDEQLEAMAFFNERFEPKLIGERAWPLMKMRRYEEARLAAQAAFATGEVWQKTVGLNALCAIEFEAGDNLASYRACREALDAGRAQGAASTVDLTNFAEASRSLFQLDEAERILIEATEAGTHWYANPWLELSDLLIREGRFAEALSGLKQIPAYRAARPAHVRDGDRNETRRAIAALLLTLGRSREALAITSKAMLTPDRRGHTSRDAFQDRSLVALLDRRARRMVAEQMLEQSVAKPWYERLLAWGEASLERLEAWRSGRQAATLLSERDRLVGTFQIGTKHAAIMPPWVVADLVEIVGSGVVLQAIDDARKRDPRPRSDAYYDAFTAEAWLRAGELERAERRAQQAIDALPSAEMLLRMRALAVLAEAKRLRGEDARHDYDRLLQTDPGLLRRLELPVPIRLRASAGEIAAATRSALARSPRFVEDAHGLEVDIDANPASGRVCLRGIAGSVLACADASSESTDDVDQIAQRLVDAFHEQAFAPRIDVSQADINSLDGSPHLDRGGLLF